MGKILDEAVIKIDYVLRDRMLAKVTLNFFEEFEVRFCRITLRQDNSLWFQPPALKEFNYAKCFAVINKSEWKEFEKKVISEFTQGLKDKIDSGYLEPEFLTKIKVQEEEDEINIDDIPF